VTGIDIDASSLAGQSANPPQKKGMVLLGSHPLLGFDADPGLKKSGRHFRGHVPNSREFGYTARE